LDARVTDYWAHTEWSRKKENRRASANRKLHRSRHAGSGSECDLPRIRSPIRPHLLKQSKCSVYISTIKSSGPRMDRSTWLSAAKCTMVRGLCCCSSRRTRLRSSNIAMHEFVPPVGRDRIQIVQVPGVGKLVQVHDKSAIFFIPLQDKVGTDEAYASGDENCVSHVKSTFGTWRWPPFRPLVGQTLNCNKKRTGSRPVLS